MKLTRDEFNRIRKLNWIKREYGSAVYNTPATNREIQLFWHDFMLYVFAEKFKKQKLYTKIFEFDNQQPVLLNDSLHITLPNQLESIAYFADNVSKPPYLVQTNTYMFNSLLVSIILIIFLITFSVFYNTKNHMNNKFLNLILNKNII